MGIPENTYKYLKSLAKNLSARIQEIDGEMSVTNPHSSTFEELRSEKFELNGKLTRINHSLITPIAKIKDQNEFCLLGNAVLLNINGKIKRYFIDSICVGKSVSISVDCQLAKAILGKGVGDKGTYKCQNTGQTISWEILEIEPYSIAKNIFKPVPVSAEKKQKTGIEELA
jgi:hypothetical protein